MRGDPTPEQLGSAQPAAKRGNRDGLADGLQQRYEFRSFQPTATENYRRADRGYSDSSGNLNQYKQAYRDVLAFDPGLKRLYASAESGNVFVFREDGKALVQEGDISIPHAHTVCVDPNTHLVYFPLENIDGHALLRIMEPPTTQ